MASATAASSHQRHEERVAEQPGEHADGQPSAAQVLFALASGRGRAESGADAARAGLAAKLAEAFGA
jgi:hypothetical protein